MNTPPSLLNLSAYTIAVNDYLNVAELPVTCQQSVAVFTNIKRNFYEAIARFDHEAEVSWGRYLFFLKVPHYIV